MARLNRSRLRRGADPRTPPFATGSTASRLRIRPGVDTFIRTRVSSNCGIPVKGDPLAVRAVAGYISRPSSRHAVPGPEGLQQR